MYTVLNNLKTILIHDFIILHSPEKSKIIPILTKFEIRTNYVTCDMTKIENIPWRCNG